MNNVEFESSHLSLSLSLKRLFEPKQLLKQLSSAKYIQNTPNTHNSQETRWNTHTHLKKDELEENPSSVSLRHFVPRTYRQQLNLCLFVFNFFACLIIVVVDSQPWHYYLSLLSLYISFCSPAFMLTLRVHYFTGDMREYYIYNFIIHQCLLRFPFIFLSFGSIVETVLGSEL